MYTRDLDALRELGSLTRVIETVQANGLADRFNVDRVKACVDSECPQYATLLDIALHGATIDVPDGFVPSGAPEHC